MAPNFKKQRGIPMKKQHREDGEYEQQGTKNKKLRRSELLIRYSNCGCRGHNKKSCYRKSKSATHGGPSTRPAAGPSGGNSTAQSAGPTSIATQPSDGPPPTAVQPPPIAGQSMGPPTAGPSNTVKTSSTKGRGWAKLPIRISQK